MPQSTTTRTAHDTTVVYYTCNGDYPALEQAVRETIAQHCGDLPIISVSQQPIAFGQNLCVGQLERSSEHALMQLRIGAELARTRFLAVCEADTLYPPQFFQFKPSCTKTYYYPRAGYIAFRGRRVYWRKMLCELMGVVARDFLLRILDVLQPKMCECMQARHAGEDARLYITPTVAEHGVVARVDLGPVVTLKSGRGMHMQTPFFRRGPRQTRPVWGSARSIWERYPCE